MRPFQPIVQPAVPFVDVLEPALQPGCIVSIEGFIPPNAEAFQINLALGPVYDESTRSPTPLHLNPRFGGNEVIRNTYSPSSGWGHEETAGIMTLVRGQQFQMMILVEPQEFKIAVNGQHFCGYAHRAPFQDINHLQIVGDVEINKVQLHTAQPPGPPPVNYPAIPFECPIPNWTAPGRVITIIGCPRSFPQRFNIDLFNTSTRDVIFHFNPRYDPNRYIVRNSCLGGMWGEEQCDTPFFHLMPDARFNIKIVCEPDFFSVFTNEQHFCYFQHRVPFNQVDGLRIDGDVDIDNITFT